MLRRVPVLKLDWLDRSLELGAPAPAAHFLLPPLSGLHVSFTGFDKGRSPVGHVPTSAQPTRPVAPLSQKRWPTSRRW